MINLEKGKEALKLSLEKRGVTKLPSADLAFVLDVSGSFDSTHRSGVTQTLLERLVPWGMVFDPDQKLDVFTFSSGESGASHVSDISPTTCENYVKNKIVDKVPGYCAGTDYAPVIKKVLQNFGWLPTEEKAAGFMGRLFGKKSEAQAEKRRSIVLFVTDGDNGDHSDCEKVLSESEKRGDEVYFLFIGISSSRTSFPFIMKMADKFSNTGLTVVKDLKKFVEMSDEEMNNELIGDELITWLKK